MLSTAFLRSHRTYKDFGMYARSSYTGNGATAAFTIPWPYVSTSHVKAKINNIVTTAFTVSGSTVTFTSPPASGAAIVIYRETSPSSRLVDYQNAGALLEGTLDTDSLQAFYLFQEALDLSNSLNFSLAGFRPGLLETNETILLYVFSRAATFEGNFVGSYAFAETAPPEMNITVEITKKPSASDTFSTVGQMVLNSGSTYGVFTSSGGASVSFAAGDVIRCRIINDVPVGTSTLVVNLHGTFTS